MNKEPNIYLNGFVNIENSLKDLNKKFLGDLSKTQAELIINWYSIVGEEIAKISWPKEIMFAKSSAKENNNILKLQVAEQDYLAIEYQKLNIIEKINLYFGFNLIKIIKLIKV
jgi:hypothetical protein